MEKKTNIAELLKNAPSGFFDLYLTTEGYCLFDCVFDGVGKRNYIRLYNQKANKSIELDPYGRVIPDGECILFPLKSEKTWDNWQSIIMPSCYGSVIIDKFGFSYLVTKDLLYPVNPTIPFSIIRWHKFDYEGARFANPEESKAFFDEFHGNGFYFTEKTKLVVKLDDAMKKAMEIGKTFARQYLPTTFDLSKKLTDGDEANFVFSNEECELAALDMAKYKDEEFKKFLCYYFKFGEKLFEMYKNGDYKIDEIQ